MELDILLTNLGRMVVAFILALPIAWDRERGERSAGLRTFPLVAVASCSFLLIMRGTWGSSIEAQARVLEGVITGIGFIGGGAILKKDERVRGTATAASIWGTGALGAAVAFERYEIAVLLSAFTFGTLRWLAMFKDELRPEEREKE